MRECDDIGVLATAGKAWSEADIARAVGGNIDDVRALLKELTETGVLSHDKNTNAIISRRIVRDEERRKRAINTGKRGGNPTLKGRVKGRVKGSLNLNVSSSFYPLSSSETKNEDTATSSNESTPFDSLDAPPLNTDSPADPRGGPLYDAVSLFKRWPTEADMLKWRKLADEALGEERVIALLREGHAAGRRLHKILMAAWELASQEGKASAKGIENGTTTDSQRGNSEKPTSHKRRLTAADRGEYASDDSPLPML